MKILCHISEARGYFFVLPKCNSFIHSSWQITHLLCVFLTFIHGGDENPTRGSFCAPIASLKPFLLLFNIFRLTFVGLACNLPDSAFTASFVFLRSYGPPFVGFGRGLQ